MKGLETCLTLPYSSTFGESKESLSNFIYEMTRKGVNIQEIPNHISQRLSVFVWNDPNETVEIRAIHELVVDRTGAIIACITPPSSFLGEIDFLRWITFISERLLEKYNLIGNISFDVVLSDSNWFLVDLDVGGNWCTLFHSVANGLSNKTYVGIRQICDDSLHNFTPNEFLNLCTCVVSLLFSSLLFVCFVSLPIGT